MATELLATGIGAASSDDFTVEAGSPVTVALKGAEFEAFARLELKDDAGAYQVRGILVQRAGEDLRVIVAPGTWRVTRPAESKACGVFYA